MKEKIKKLLESGYVQDIIIGIELARKLSNEDFKELFEHGKEYKYRPSEYISFDRDNKEYHVTPLGFVYVYERVDNSIEMSGWIILH